MAQPSRHLLAGLIIDVSLISDGDNCRTKSKSAEWLFAMAELMVTREAYAPSRHQ